MELRGAVEARAAVHSWPDRVLKVKDRLLLTRFDYHDPSIVYGEYQNGGFLRWLVEVWIIRCVTDDLRRCTKTCLQSRAKTARA